MSASLPRLLLILDRHAAGDEATWIGNLTALVGALPEDGRVWLQLRAKRIPAEERRRLFRVARAVSEARPDLPILVNGTSGQALHAGFQGVHWPEALRPAEPPVTASRMRWISAAVHDLEGARGARRAGARVVTWSPVFDPRSKPGSGRGIEELHRFAEASPVPVLALGGITVERARQCIDAGAHGVAVLSSVSRPGCDPAAAARELLDVLPPTLAA